MGLVCPHCGGSNLYKNVLTTLFLSFDTHEDYDVIDTEPIDSDFTQNIMCADCDNSISDSTELVEDPEEVDDSFLCAYAKSSDFNCFRTVK